VREADCYSGEADIGEAVAESVEEAWDEEFAVLVTGGCLPLHHAGAPAESHHEDANSEVDAGDEPWEGEAVIQPLVHNVELRNKCERK